MKTLIFLFLVSLNYSVDAQKSVFLRVYDLAGKKIYKGSVFTITDSSLLLVGKKEPVTIPVTAIGSIKTKHSAGNNLLIGSAIGATTFAVIGATSAEPDNILYPSTSGESAAAGALIGLPVGAAIGGLTILFKHSKTFFINGDIIKWKEFESYISQKTSTGK